MHNQTKGNFHLSLKGITTFIAIAFSSTLVLYFAWICDDAYITFRYVDNFISGYGLVYNAGERVQGFTHPLWLFLLSFGEVIRFDLFYFAIILGLFFNGLTILFYTEMTKNNKGFYFGLAFFVIVLYSCSSFLDFQTSGLESSLTHFLLLMITRSVLTKNDENDKKSYYSLFFWSGLLLFNRLDHFFIIAPILAYKFFTSNQKKLEKIKGAFIGLLPIILWEIFSIVYYGFPFPNTRYAKIGNYTLLDGLHLGILYIIDFVVYEIFPALVVVICSLLLAANYKKVQKELLILSIGAVFQLMYIVYIGGDFMRGRFLLSTFFEIVLIISIVISKRITLNLVNHRFITRTYYFFYFNKNLQYFLKRYKITNIKRIFYLKEEKKRRQLVAFSIIFYLGFIGVLSNLGQSLPFKAPEPFGRMIVNEREFYFEANGLIGRMIYNNTHIWKEIGLLNREKAKTQNFTVMCCAIGMLGYYSGINVTIIDVFGITDSFIAHCPVDKNNIYRPGHVPPKVPQEYYDLRITGNKSIVWEDEELYQMYKEIDIITTGEILSLNRFITIFNFWLKHGI